MCPNVKELGSGPVAAKKVGTPSNGNTGKTFRQQLIKIH